MNWTSAIARHNHLSRFHKVGKDVADLRAAVLEQTGVDDPDLDGQAGRIYVGGLHIHRDGNGWLLVIANCDYSGDLKELEAKLFDYGKAEGILDPWTDLREEREEDIRL